MTKTLFAFCVTIDSFKFQFKKLEPSEWARWNKELELNEFHKLSSSLGVINTVIKGR